MDQAEAVLNQPTEAFSKAINSDSFSSTTIRRSRQPSLLPALLDGCFNTTAQRLNQWSEQQTQDLLAFSVSIANSIEHMEVSLMKRIFVGAVLSFSLISPMTLPAMAAPAYRVISRDAECSKGAGVTGASDCDRL